MRLRSARPQTGCKAIKVARGCDNALAAGAKLSDRSRRSAHARLLLVPRPTLTSGDGTRCSSPIASIPAAPEESSGLAVARRTLVLVRGGRDDKGVPHFCKRLGEAKVLSPFGLGAVLLRRWRGCGFEDREAAGGRADLVEPVVDAYAYAR